jgi:hypothetical protein
MGSAVRLVGSADAKCTVFVRVRGGWSCGEGVGEDSIGVATL